MKLHLSDFNLTDDMGRWLNLFATSAQKKRITLQLEVASPIFIRADREKIERICYNLLSNAMKYTPEGGRIIFGATADNDLVHISVSDNGMSIEAGDIPYIFDHFYQARNSGSGTGIGLALVKAFTELHHGQANVTSEKGKGSVFSITLPLKQKGEVSQQEAQTTPPLIDTNENCGEPNMVRHLNDIIQPTDSNKSEVLIIDDNNDIRTYLRSALSDLYKVSEAADGKTGLEIARRIVPDIIISDIMMPIMDGLEFCNQLKNDKAISHIPVILLTARSLDEQRAEGYEHGADAYIAKPFSLHLLLSRIENLIQSRRQLSELFSGNNENEDISKLSTETDKNFITQLRRIIQVNLADSDLSVEKIGDEIGLSRVQLYRKVKALTGYSPVEMLRKARLARARQLLQTTDKNVSEVAYAVGFSTPSYFSKCYKEEFGESPKK